jgi:hypothetical protein
MGFAAARRMVGNNGHRHRLVGTPGAPVQLRPPRLAERALAL